MRDEEMREETSSSSPKSNQISTMGNAAIIIKR
jgi:hypothetical protein